MIFGIGIDIVEIKRIKNIVDKYPAFLDKYFSSGEVEYFKTKKSAYQSIAGYFASKEAVSKALGTGFRDYNLRDIEITKNSLNRPSVKLHNNCKFLADEKNIDCIYLSISHSENYAVANAVVTNKDLQL